MSDETTTAKAKQGETSVNLDLANLAKFREQVKKDKEANKKSDQGKARALKNKAAKK